MHFKGPGTSSNYHTIHPKRTSSGLFFGSLGWVWGLPLPLGGADGGGERLQLRREALGGLSLAGGGHGEVPRHLHRAQAPQEGHPMSCF